MFAARLYGQPEGGRLPDQKLTIAETLRGFTTDAVYASFSETEVGMLKAGLCADFVVLRDDPLNVPAATLAIVRIRSTWGDGKAV